MPVDPETTSSPSSRPALAAFDFDGTLTWCDTLLPFLRHAVGARRFWQGFGRLVPVLAAYRLGLMHNERAKVRVLAHYLVGWSEERLAVAARSFVAGPLEEMINGRAIEKLRWHQAAGHEVVIVSASPEFYIRPWAERLGVAAVLGTRLEMEHGRFTGRLSGANCYGPEKLRRLTRHFERLEDTDLFAYGDSRGDHDLLAAAQQRFYRTFTSGPRPLSTRLAFVRGLIG
ncbi:HAD family hydrolase [Marinivivus vitaminiproducens]|uniref:HAD family hydrolase n=1 Tax=Marinivivus vitaminiproducens TaxID=3035935 RepID=UPI0027A826BA|nr:HAD-IB family hydrolase [Geminicoccaceae bacterium SCSIO 64248]